jgi:hypothetical protein
MEIVTECGPRVKKLCISCNVCFERSFASYKHASSYSSKNLTNIRKTKKTSGNKFIFDCFECNHEFEMKMTNVTILGQWCPFCSNQKLCTNENCEMCFNKSLASFENINEMFDFELNKLIPRQIFKGCSKRFNFICQHENCRHKYDQSAHYLTTKTNSKCNYCSNTRQKICDDENCQMCFDKSFASHEKARYFSIKNNIDPRQISKHSNKKYIFECDICYHEFSVILGHVSNKNNPTWCPYCKNKTEKKLHDWIESQNIYVEKEVKFEWLKNPETNYYLRFDFLIVHPQTGTNIIIELDGDQHFVQVGRRNTPEDHQQRDKYKMRLALRRGLKIIRILQRPVWTDRFDWKTSLLFAIHELAHSSKMVKYLDFGLNTYKNNNYDL